MWYGVSLLFRSTHAKSMGEETLWEEMIVLIDATSEKEAVKLGREYAIEQQITYDVSQGDSVTWKFDSVLDICEVAGDVVGSGTEVFSRFMKESEICSLKSRF